MCCSDRVRAIVPPLFIAPTLGLGASHFTPTILLSHGLHVSVPCSSFGGFAGNSYQISVFKNITISCSFL